MCICPILRQSHKIEHIDFSENILCDDWGMYIRKIISDQNERRNNIVWMYNLRNELPENNEYKKGLISVGLDKTNISDKFIDNLFGIMQYDNYICNFSLRNNLISKKGISSALNYLKTNFQVIYLDLLYLFYLVKIQAMKKNT